MLKEKDIKAIENALAQGKDVLLYPTPYGAKVLAYKPHVIARIKDEDKEEA